MEKKYDTLHMGRSSIDLYSSDIGSPFEEIKNFSAYVGGSPTNISVGAKRLGLNSILLTGVGEDPVGNFILNFLNKEGVVTDFVAKKKDKKSSAVLLGIEPPDKFPLVFFRENCADIDLDIDDVLKTPLPECKIFQFVGTNLSKDPSRAATIFAAEWAKREGLKVVLDLDFRPNQWFDPRAFGVAIRGVLPLVDIVIGTQDEIRAAVLINANDVLETESKSDTKVKGDINQAIDTLLSFGPEMLLEKCGEKGSKVHFGKEKKSIEVPGFRVEVQNVLGAGDAFAAGFLYGYVKGWDIYKSCRLGNACGAIVVTKHGCANFTPLLNEVEDFIASQGGY